MASNDGRSDQWGAHGIKPPSSRFALEHHGKEIPLRLGQFRIGRSLGADLLLDSPTVSRHHARLEVTDEAVLLYDTHSANGVHVNGTRVSTSARLSVGDKIRIGDEEIVLVRAERGARRGEERLSVDSIEALVELMRHREVSGRQTDPARIRVTPSRPRAPPPPAPAKPIDPPDAPRAMRPSGPPRPDPFETQKVLSEAISAEIALANGNPAEAERRAVPGLARVRGQVADGTPVAPELAEQAARLAIRLATATGKSAWVDYPTRIYSLLRKPFPATVCRELGEALPRVASFDVEAFRQYAAMLRGIAGQLEPTERALLEQVNVLEQTLTQLAP